MKQIEIVQSIVIANIKFVHFLNDRPPFTRLRKAELFLEEFEMNLDEFCKDLPGGDNRSEVVCKLVSELIQGENNEEILAFWCDERDASDDSESKLLYYIVMDKRFFEIHVDSDSFGYKSYFLKHLSSFEEKVVPDRNDSYGCKCSSYFSDGNENVKSYTVIFSFSIAKGESDKAKFSLSASTLPKDEERIRFNKLRDFVREFYKVVTGL